jgi:H+/gluconate symporter-like permease
MGLLGILIGLGLLVWFAYHGWSVLVLAPAAALIAAAFSGEPLLAHWTQTFMGGAASFLAQFFPIFLLGAVFGRLMDDSGSISAIARFVTETMGTRHAIVAVVLAGALVTYGGVSLFVAFFVLAPMAEGLFRAASVPRRLMPAAVALGTSTFTMSALPGTPSIQNAIPMPFFGTTTFAAPGVGLIASAIMLGFGLWWLARAETIARAKGENFSPQASLDLQAAAPEDVPRERATIASAYDPAEIPAQHGVATPPTALALLPLAVVIGVNFLMSIAVLPRLDTSYLAEERFGATSLLAVGGVWAVVVALLAAILTLVLTNRQRILSLRESVDAGANASVLPALSVASLVGFGAVVAALPAFGVVRDFMLTVGGDNPLLSLAVATNLLAALTGSASGGLTIALEALGETYLALARASGLDPALLHRIAVIGAGTLDSLPHNGAVVTLLAVCGTTHRESYFDVFMVAIVGAVIALAAAILVGTAAGSF